PGLESSGLSDFVQKEVIFVCFVLFCGNVPRRRKRGWVWNQFFVLEEYTGKEPLHVGRLHSDFDNGDGMIRYTLEGEGAGVAFVIDDHTGDIHAIQSLDREEKAQYTLLARALDRRSNQSVEPASEFIVRVQDINDNEPLFASNLFRASVPEMSQSGTFVIRVTAHDADDPMYGSSAKVVYSLVEGHPYFSVDPETGEIRTTQAGMDREARDHYQVVIQAKDMWGKRGGLTGTTTIAVTLTDINDNPPRFINIRESTPVFSTIGRVKTTDADVGENAMVTYNILPSQSAELFDIITDPDTQEGVIKLAKPLDYEAQSLHTLRVGVVNTLALQGPARALAKDEASIRVLVLDSNEPPEFDQHGYEMQVAEDVPVGTLVGTVSAKDPDAAKIPIRYSTYFIDRQSDLGFMFDINASTGEIRTRDKLDREQEASFNLLLKASEISESDTSQIGQATAVVRVGDVNDNAPEIVPPTDLSICENAYIGEVLHVLSAVDHDEPSNGPIFHFTLTKGTNSNPNFTLQDNLNNTASIISKRDHFNRRDVSHYVLPVQVMDSGFPPQANVSFLTLSICKCNSKGIPVVCGTRASHGPAGLSHGGSCSHSLIIVLFLTLRRQQKEPFMLEEDDALDNIISYDDEGGGEEDTEAFDISALQRPENGMAVTSKPREDLEPTRLHNGPQKYSPNVVLQQPNDSLDITSFINTRVREADRDPGIPPYDSIQAYDYEGVGSVAGSLSSLTSVSCDNDQNYNYLQEWGPRFHMLAQLYRNSEEKFD
uniref:Cadherin 6 n=1 Tax=Eptatretus burgeri TaxID=7764 RepID=A0A8C4NGC3_EPTBU